MTDSSKKIADRGGDWRGVKNPVKFADVLYGWSLTQNNLIQLKNTPGFKNQKGFIIFLQFKPKPAIVYAFRQMTSYF